MACAVVIWREHSGNIQWTFRPLSGNIQVTTREHSAKSARYRNCLRCRHLKEASSQRGWGEGWEMLKKLGRFRVFFVPGVVRNLKPYPLPLLRSHKRIAILAHTLREGLILRSNRTEKSNPC
jgi:hypothetical protein